MINWGIAGVGKMGNIFSEAIKETSNAKLVLTASKSNKKIETIESTNYENLFKNKNIDAIYISTTNNLHSDLIFKSIENGKNVLCEKPMCTDLEKIMKIKDLSKNYNLQIFEAIAYYSHPQTINLMDLINSNTIGKIEHIECSFGFKTRVKPNSRLFDKKLGGGVILDLGCYPISFLMLFCNDYNLFKFTNKKIEICETDVENYAEADLILNKTIKAKIKISFKSHLHNKCIIYGSKGKIVLADPWLPQKKSYIEIETSDHYYKKFVKSNLSVFANQITNISNLFLKKDESLNNIFDIDKSITCMKLLEMWKKN